MLVVGGVCRGARSCRSVVCPSVQGKFHDASQALVYNNAMASPSITPEDHALPMHYPGFVFRTLRGDGIAAEALLDGTQLTESLLCDPDYRCDFARLRRFYRNAIEHSGDPHVGIRLARRFRAAFVGLPFLTAAKAASFEDALATLGRLLALTFPALTLEGPRAPTTGNAGEYAVRIHPKWPLGDIAYFGTSSALVVCDGLFRELLQVQQITLRAEIAMAKPEGWDAVAPELGFPVRFGAAHNSLIFPSAVLAAPLPTSDPINHRQLLQVCDQLARPRAPADAPVQQVLAFLDDSRNLSVPFAQAADRLGYSERSLRRQLARSGTTYRELVRLVRERAARERLKNPALPVQAIAFELGFDTPSNFARSFKEWTGETPSEYRARQARGGADGQN